MLALLSRPRWPFLYAAFVAAALSASACSPRRSFLKAIGDYDAKRALDSVRGQPTLEFSVEERGGVHLTPLMVAADTGSLFVVTGLLEMGADPNFANEDGWTALSYACFGRRGAVARALLGGRADGSHATKQGETCEILNARSEGTRRSELDVVQALADSAVPLDLRRMYPRLLREGQVGILEVYLHPARDLDLGDDGGLSLLIAAVEAGQMSVVRSLVVRGAAPRDPAGWAALRRSAEKLEPSRASLFAATFAAESATADERVAAYDREEARQVELNRAEWEAKLAEVRKAEAAQRARETPAAAAAPSSRPPVDYTPQICLEPGIRECRERGRSCEDCFYDLLRQNLRNSGASSAAPDSPAPAGYTRCGGVLCGQGYVCCVGATRTNSGAETCRPSSPGCKQGWDAERVK